VAGGSTRSEMLRLPPDLPPPGPKERLSGVLVEIRTNGEVSIVTDCAAARESTSGFQSSTTPAVLVRLAPLTLSSPTARKVLITQSQDVN